MMMMFASPIPWNEGASLSKTGCSEPFMYAQVRGRANCAPCGVWSVYILRMCGIILLDTQRTAEIWVTCVQFERPRNLPKQLG